MAKSDFNSSSLKDHKLPERFIIPSNVVSRIGSPLNNFIEVPNRENIDFSGVDTGFGIETTQNFAPTPSTETLSISQSQIISELDSLKNQVRTITKKLDYNLAILKEKEDKNNALTSILIARSREKGKDKSVIEEINCSCNKGCLVF
jgi:hypothetical protein